MARILPWLQKLHAALGLCGVKRRPIRRPFQGRIGFEELENRTVPSVVTPGTYTANPTITYHGGALLQNVQVTDVYYAGYDATLRSELDAFFTNITTSKFLTQLDAEYSVTGHTIGAGSFLGEDIQNTQSVPAAGSTLSDSKIQTMLTSELNAGRLTNPTSTLNKLYVVFPPPGVEITISGANSETGFLGYHSSFTWTGKTVAYAVLPYQGSVSGVNNAELGVEAEQSFNLASDPFTELQDLTGVAAHEFTESITDTTNAWYDSVDKSGGLYPGGFENADLANAELATYHGYVMQEIPSIVEFGPSSQQVGPPSTGSDADFLISQINNPTTGSFNGVIATFTDIDGVNEPASNYTVSINWSDGATNSSNDGTGHVTVLANGDGTFRVVGQHTYTQPAGTRYGSNDFNFDGLEVFVTDSSGEAAWNKPPVTLASAGSFDATPPTVSLTAPTNNSFTHNNTPTLTATAADNTGGSGLASVQFQYSSNGGSTWNNAGSAETSGPFSYLFPAALSDGVYQVRAIAKDVTGNSTISSIVSFTIDTVAPTVTITAPSNNSFTNNNTPTLTAAAADNTGGSGLASVQFQYSYNSGAWTNAGTAETAGPFSFTFTSNLADGSYQTRAIALDNSGNSTTSATVSFTIDTVAPTISITAPTNNSTTNNTPMLAATATDNAGGSGLASVQFQYSSNGGTSWTNAGTAETSGPFSYTFTSGLADGSYLAQAIAIDNAGNSTTATAVSFTVIDTVAPTVSITAPANNSFANNNTPTLMATAADNTGGSGLASVQFQYSTNGGPWTNAGTPETSGPFSYTFTSSLADGVYQVQAIAVDNAGNIATSTAVFFTIDTVAPTVTITAPTNNSYTNINTPTLTATAADNTGGSGLASVQFQYSSNGGTSWTNAGTAEPSGPFSYTFTSSLADGVYQVQAIAVDNAGNSATSTAVSFTIDTVAPTVSITAPTNNSYTNINTTILTATAADNTGGSGLASVQFQYSSNSTTWINAGTPETSGPFNYTFTSSLTDGVYEVRAIAVDNAGNSTTSATVSFTIDTVAPTVSITAPTNNSYTNINTPTLTATSADNTGGSGLASVQFQYSSNGTTWTNAGTPETAGPFSYTFTSSLADGSYEVRAITIDNAGNSTTSTAVSFTIDTVTPTVTVTAPTNNSYTNNNTPTLTATAADNTGGSGLASVQFQYSSNGTTWTNAGTAETSGPFSYTFTSTLADGSYQTRAIAIDNAGNSTTSTAVSFTIDTVAPTVSITAPTNNSYTNINTPTLTATAADNTGGSGLVSVQFQYSSNGTTWTNAGTPETSGPFSFTFTSTLADGVYEARAIAIDNAGNSTTSTTVSYTIDTVAPTVSITAPTNNSFTNNNTPTVTATSADNTGGSGLASVQFQYSSNGTTWTNAGTTETSGPFSYTFTSSLADGVYEVRAIAIDNAGNSTTSTAVSFTIDTVAPTVSITAPINNSFTNNNTPTLTATAADNTGGSGLASVQFQYSSNGTTWTNAGTPETAGPFSFTFTSSLADGVYEVRAIALDNAGNSTTSTAASFTIDTVAPTVTITAPGNNSYTNNNSPTLTATAADNTGGSGLVSVQFEYSNGTTWTNAGTPETSGPFSYSFTSSLADGVYEVRAIALDDAGNSTTSTAVSFTIDTVAPTVSITAPTNNSFTNNNTPTLTATAADNTGGSGLISVQFQYSSNGTTWTNAGTAETSGPFSYTFTSTLADGSYQMRAIAIDNASNSTTSATVSFTIDTVAPTVSITAPTNNSYTNINIPTLTATAADNTGGSGLASVQFQYSSNGTTWTNAGTAETAGPFSYTFTSNLADGVYEVRAIATDNAGNSTTSTAVSFTIDTVAPTVTITAPANNSFTNNNTPTLTATAADNTGGSGLASVQFQYSSNGTTWTNAGTAETSGPFSYTFTSTLADGSYQTRAIAIDNAGNSTTSTAVSFTIDTVAPTVSITAPTNNSYTNINTPTLTATAADNTGGSGLVSVQFQYSSNGTTWTNAGTPETSGPFSFTFTSTLADGVYEARAIAIDNAGNSTTSTTVSYTIDTVAPTVTITAPSNNSYTNNNTPTLTATAADNTGGSGLANVQFQYSSNGTTWTNAGTAETSGPFSYTFTSSLADGVYEVQAIATDNAGNSTTSSTFTFTIDTVPPTVTITAPTNSSFTNNNTPTLMATAADNTGGSGLASVQFQYSNNGTTWTNAGTPETAGPFSYTFTSSLADGVYEVQAIATDNAGNSTTSSPITFSIVPELTLSSSANPSALPNNPTFTATVVGTTPTGSVTFSDTYQGVTIPLGTVTLTSAGQASFTPTFTFGGGTHTITADYSGDTNNPSYVSTLTQTMTGVAAPTVASVTENGGITLNSDQISEVTQLEVTFSEPVSLQEGAFTLTRVLLPNGVAGDNATITPAISLNAAGTVATLTFDNGAPSTGVKPIDNGSLADGNWTLTVHSADVASTGTGTPPMFADFTQTDVRRLFGLVTPGGTIVGASDFTQFSNTFGLSSGQPGYNAAFDFTNTGPLGNAIDATDFIQFSQRFGESI